MSPTGTIPWPACPHDTAEQEVEAKARAGKVICVLDTYRTFQCPQCGFMRDIRPTGVRATKPEIVQPIAAEDPGKPVKRAA